VVHGAVRRNQNSDSEDILNSWENETIKTGAGLEKGAKASLQSEHTLCKLQEARRPAVRRHTLGGCTRKVLFLHRKRGG